MTKAVVRCLAIILATLSVAGTTVPVRAEPRQDQSPGTERDILIMLRLPPDHQRATGYGGDYGDNATSRQRRKIALRIARRYHLRLVDDGWPMPLLGIDCITMRVPAGMAIDAAVEEVSHDPSVAWSQPRNTFRTLGGTQHGADPLFAAQPAATAWHLADLHRAATGRGITVAVIDSGIERTHPDLVRSIVTLQNFVSEQPTPAERHGTAVAGIIAATADNGIGIAGIAPNARLMGLRACWQSSDAPTAPTYCDSLSLAKALQYAILHGAQVINMSLSGPYDRLIDKLLEIAKARQMSAVAAYDPALAHGGFPASRPGVIAVTDSSLASYPRGVYNAPGRDIPTTEPGDRWNLVDGSSYAAAHVSGLIALAREGPLAAREPALASSEPSGGVLDACATLRLSGKQCGCSCGVAKR